MEILRFAGLARICNPRLDGHRMNSCTGQKRHGLQIRASDSIPDINFKALGELNDLIIYFIITEIFQTFVKY